MIQDIYPHRLWNQYRPEAEAEQDSVVLYFTAEGVLNRLRTADPHSLPEAERIHAGDGQGMASPTRLDSASAAEDNAFDPDAGDKLQLLEFPRLRDFAGTGIPDNAELIYLFSVDEEKYFLLWERELKPEKPVTLPGFSFTAVRALRDRELGPKTRIFACITGLQLYNWYRKNRFCGCCGGETERDGKERALRCPRCGNLVYPRIVPAVIVGVCHGDRILLTKYRTGFRHYALVAGFTEIGETLEQTVAREVMEETGLRVKNIRYYKSQPWGIVDDLLAGFYCDVDGDPEIRMDQNELKLAEWTRREDIVLQPDDFSLTNEMMRCFKNGEGC